MGATTEAIVADAVVTLRVAAPAARVDFETWYLREHPKVVAALTWVAGDPHVAADASDEAFARACADWRRVGEITLDRFR